MTDKTSLPEHSSDMDPEEFRRYGHQLIDWVAEYLQNTDRHRVLTDMKPGELRQQLPGLAPEAAESFSDVIDDFNSLIVPGMTHWNHPAFFAYFSVSSSGPGILGELLTAALNNNGMLWRSGPSATELEQTVLDWLRQMLQLPQEYFGIINDTASVSTMVAIAAAREAAGLRIREEGMSGRTDLPRLRLYASEHAHSSVEKGGITLGIGQAGMQYVGCDDEYRMRPDLLEKHITDDIAKGWKPFCVVATVGTTSSTSVDPVNAIADICATYGVWLHVDGAYGGFAGMVPEKRWAFDGVNRADSIVVNPHKWLYVPMDISVLYCRKPDVLRRAFSLIPEYLKTPEGGKVVDYMDYGIQLGRRFRSLKLWMVLRYFGAERIRAMLSAGCALAQELRHWAENNPRFELLAPTPFSVVCLRYVPRGTPEQGREEFLGRFNARLLDAVNATGEVFVSHTKLNGKYTIRIAIGNLKTTLRHVRRAYDLLCEHGARLESADAG